MRARGLDECSANSNFAFPAELYVRRMFEMSAAEELVPHTRLQCSKHINYIRRGLSLGQHKTIEQRIFTFFDCFSTTVRYETTSTAIEAVAWAQAKIAVILARPINAQRRHSSVANGA